jgi:hypothetical protein
VSKALKPAALRAFADEHLAYEIEMLFAAVRGRDIRILSDDASLVGFFHNARVEAFVSHLRILIGFLFPDVYRPKRNDITARDYLCDVPGREGQWEDWRGPLSDALRSAKDRADKEVSHLTDRRIAGRPPEKGWVMEPLANELREILLRFLAAAEPDCLGERISALVPRVPF